MGFLDILKNNSGDTNKIPSIGDQLLTLSDVIAPSAVSISPRDINVSGVTTRVYYAVSYPRFLNDGWLEPVLNLAREIDVSIFIHPIDTVETLKKFQKKVAEVQSQINVKEAEGGERILPGHAYIAPGDKHLLLNKSGANYITKLDDSPAVNRHKPSVDVLFDSAAAYAGKNVIGLILTGMGKDGAIGMRHMKDAGAYNFSQNEHQSIHY